MCTAVRFVDGEDNMFFGRNLDWSFSYGEKVLYTPKDYNYQPVFNGEDRNHAVLGIGIVVDDTPPCISIAPMTQALPLPDSISRAMPNMRPTV